MQQNIWCIQRKRIRPGLILISAFPKMPSYLRRAAVQHALGVYPLIGRGWNSGKQRDQKSGKPYLKSEKYAMPVFYHDVMYRENTEEKDAAFLKLYDGHDWKWFAVRLKHTDMEYLRKHWSGKKLRRQRWRKSTTNISCVFRIRKRYL